MPNRNVKKHSSKFHGNDSLPVLHIDNAYVSYREDKFVLAHFVANMPNGDFEQARIMIREDDLRTVIDTMCDVINYYPKKSSSKLSSPTKKK